MYCKGGFTTFLYLPGFVLMCLLVTRTYSAPVDAGVQVNDDITVADLMWTDDAEWTGDAESSGDVEPAEDIDWPTAPRAPAPLMLQLGDGSRIGRLPSTLTGNELPEAIQCGVRPKDDSGSRGRIAIGITAKTRWPWMVQILRKEDRELICGGTLLSDRHVITAAHCIKGSSGEHGPDDLIIRIGDHYAEEIEPLEHDADIDCIFVHPKYKASTLQHDIAVLKLKVNPENPITFSPDLLPACLPEKKEFRTGHSCFITGWGHTDFFDYFYGLPSPNLREAKVPLLGNRQCTRLGREYGTELTKKMQCAGYVTGTDRADTCKKDSGGPLICENEEGVWKLWGITSWGDNTFCEGTPDLPSPGVYTRVDKYLSWIDLKLKQSCPAL